MRDSLNLLEGYADVLFEDRHLVILNKYSGIPVIPQRHRTSGDVVSLRERLEQITGEKIFVVHRIDRDTSGCIVFCRTARVHRMISMQFERRIVKKEYLVMVQGTMAGSDTIDVPLRQFGSGRMGISNDGKPSRTEISVLEQLPGATLLKARPLTGRRHQIRVHLYHRGNPVLGDRLYGTNRPVGGCERMMLHAASISFYYPEGQLFTITAPVDFQWKTIENNFRQPEFIGRSGNGTGAR